MKVRARSDKQQQVRGRRRARLTMRLLTWVCALVALGIGAAQVSSDGLQTFLNRPEGVGATPDADDGPLQAAAPRPTRPRTPNVDAKPEADAAPPPDVEPEQAPDDVVPADPEPQDDHHRRGHHRPDGRRRPPPNADDRP